MRNETKNTYVNKWRPFIGIRKHEEQKILHIFDYMKI